MSERPGNEMWEAKGGPFIMPEEHRAALAAKDAEIARLRAALSRVRAQRDRLAVDVHDTAQILAQVGGRVRPNQGADETLAKYGLAVNGTEVKEIEG